MMYQVKGFIESYTDHYFNRTKRVIGKFGDCQGTYAIFMRRPVVFAPRLALQWLEETGRDRNTKVTVDQRYDEGKWVGAGEPMMYISNTNNQQNKQKTNNQQKHNPTNDTTNNTKTMCAD